MWQVSESAPSTLCNAILLDDTLQSLEITFIVPVSMVTSGVEFGSRV